MATCASAQSPHSGKNLKKEKSDLYVQVEPPVFPFCSLPRHGAPRNTSLRVQPPFRYLYALMRFPEASLLWAEQPQLCLPSRKRLSSPLSIMVQTPVAPSVLYWEWSRAWLLFQPKCPSTVVRAVVRNLDWEFKEYLEQVLDGWRYRSSANAINRFPFPL